MAKVHFTTPEFINKEGKTQEMKDPTVVLSQLTPDEVKAIGADKGFSVYIDGAKKGLALGFDQMVEIKSQLTGLKGKEFMDKMTELVTEKYGDLGEKAKVNFTNTNYFDESGKKVQTKDPRIVLTNLSQDAFTKIAKDGGRDAYIDSKRKAMALGLEAKIEVMADTKGLKGAEFYEKLEEGVSKKYGIEFASREKEPEISDISDMGR